MKRRRTAPDPTACPGCPRCIPRLWICCADCFPLLPEHWQADILEDYPPADPDDLAAWRERIRWLFALPARDRLFQTTGARVPSAHR